MPRDNVVEVRGPIGVTIIKGHTCHPRRSSDLCGTLFLKCPWRQHPQINPEVRIGSHSSFLQCHSAPKLYHGTNRSTKAAGKLKVLPEQPDQPLSAKGSGIQQPFDESEAPVLTEIPNDAKLSDDDVDEDGEELQDPEDVEVWHPI